MLADGDPILLEHLLHGVLANREVVAFPVHGKGHIVLVQCHRDGDAAGDRQRDATCHCRNNHVFLGHRSLPGLRLSGPYRLGQPSRAVIQFQTKPENLSGPRNSIVNLDTRAGEPGQPPLPSSEQRNPS